MGLNQDKTEANSIVNKWFQNHADGLLETKFNAVELGNEIARRGHDKITLDNLTEARLALGDAQKGGVLIYAPKKKQPDFQQSNDGSQKPNHARREEKVQAVQLAANDVNSPQFQQRNYEARLRFEDLVERGPISYRHNREDRGLTAARREILLKIKVVARQRDSEGMQVLLYENMVKQAEEQIRKFEAENSRREMS